MQSDIFTIADMVQETYLPKGDASARAALTARTYPRILIGQQDLTRTSIQVSFGGQLGADSDTALYKQ